jgi:formamidopyrimidine-DNA glycosylase
MPRVAASDTRSAARLGGGEGQGMPELPEAEKARLTLERLCLDRRIVDIEDGDRFVCRPHEPGELYEALVGARVIGAGRHGKFLWLDTDRGHELGLHLGMGGSFRSAPEPAQRGWDRIAWTLDDGTRVALRDKRRLSRAHLGAGIDHLGPDALRIDARTFRRRVGSGRAPIKARLLDQSVLAGVGNLLADEALWAARIDPRAPAGSLDDGQLDALRRSLRAAIRAALKPKGGSGRGIFARARRSGACPRCESPLGRATVGGRTTYWCWGEQAQMEVA